MAVQDMSRLEAWTWLMGRLNRTQFDAAGTVAARVPGETVTTPWGVQLQVYRADPFGAWRFKVGETIMPHQCTDRTCPWRRCAFAGIE